MVSLRSTFAAVFLLTNLFFLSAASAADPEIKTGVMKVRQLSGYGKKLWLEGRLVDDQGRQWNVTLMPGHNNIWSLAVWGWSTSKQQFVKVFTKELYAKDMYNELKRGGRMIADGAKLAYRTGIKDFLLTELPKDFCDIGRDACAAYQEGGPGWLLAAGTSMVGNALECCGDVVGGGGCIVGGAAYGCVGAGYSILAPAVVWMWKPVSGILAAALPGTLVPGLAYVWNGFDWVMINGEAAILSGRKVRDGHDTWFFYMEPTSTVREPRVLSKEALNTVIEASLVQGMTTPQREALQQQKTIIAEKIKAIEAALKEAQDDLSKVVQEEHETLVKAPVTQLNDLIQKSWEFSKSDFDEETRTILVNDAKLSQLVRSVAEKTGTNLSEEQISEVLKKIHENVEALKKAY